MPSSASGCDLRYAAAVVAQRAKISGCSGTRARLLYSVSKSVMVLPLSGHDFPRLRDAGQVRRLALGATQT
jgi:hypothetical protein